MATVSEKGLRPSPERIIPPLEPGDRLSRAEFERRDDAMTNLKKAELIEGVVYMPSPVRVRRLVPVRSDHLARNLQNRYSRRHRCG